MSKIVDLLTNRLVQNKTEPTKVVEILEQKRLNKLKTIAGIAQEYGTDDDLDLIPISREEDRLFCFEGSPVAYYCEMRMQDRATEETLRHLYNSNKSMICGHCRKLWLRCRCQVIFHF